MKQSNPTTLPGNRTSRPGATTSELAGLEKWLGGIELPQSYVQMMRDTNGYTGTTYEWIYIELWPIEEIPRLNEGYEVAEGAPGLLLIGTDGGGEGFALDTRREPMPVLMLPLVSMSVKDGIVVGVDFEDFIHRLRNGAAVDWTRKYSRDGGR